ncbi:MAG: hypothetical protein WC450_03105 [Candidatus Omnitrophota bacterium]
MPFNINSRKPVMAMNITPRFSLKQCASALILTIAWGIVAVNITDYYQTYSQTRQKRQDVPYTFPGIQFSGLQDILQNTETIGYLTDKDLNEQQHALQFAQAQFMLAPVILDTNFPGHEYILLDCSRPEITWALINKFRLRPLRRNQFGIVLARNPRSLKVAF